MKSNLKAHVWKRRKLPQNTNLLCHVLARFDSKLKHLVWNLIWKHTFENGESCVKTKLSCSNKVFEVQMFWESDWRSFFNRMKYTATSNLTVNVTKFMKLSDKEFSNLNLSSCTIFSCRWKLNYEPKDTQEKNKVEPHKNLQQNFCCKMVAWFPSFKNTKGTL